ncbi:energy transducer TonB [Ferruginibacter profundus]
MKKALLFFAGIFVCMLSFSQEIVNLVFVSDNGITDNIKDAHSYIVVKKYPSCFQRLDYGINKPLQRLKTYSDSSLSVLEGDYYEYDTNGRMIKSGYYENNLKARTWYYYNDTFKVILKEQYEAGVLINTINPDTIKDKTKDETAVKKVEVEAQYGKGKNDWGKYLSKNLNGDVADNSVAGGEVVVQFVVNISGTCTDVHLAKSVEFVLDEEAIRVIEKSPLWQPAFQDGRKVNAYRRQPINFSKQ